jgi:hypothetical protein
MFEDNEKLAKGIGLTILFLLPVVLWALTQFGWLSIGDPRVQAALITITGFALTALLNISVAWWKERRERFSVASALLSELYAQADLVAMCGSISNDHALRKHPMYVGRLEPYLPPTPVLFASLASRLPMLPPKAVSGLVAFHGAVEKGTKLLSLLEKAQPPTMSDTQTHLNTSRLQSTNLHATLAIAKGWQSAAYLAVSAIKSLREFSSESKRGPEAEKIDKLMEELAEIALKEGTPRIPKRALPPKSSSLAFVETEKVREAQP